MACREKIQVSKNLTDIVENVNPLELLPYLQENDVLTEDDVERVRNTGVTRREKIMMLLNILPNRGSQAHKYFILSLQEDYPWLAESIEKTEAGATHARPSVSSPKVLNHKVLSKLSKHMDVLTDWKHFGRALLLSEPDIIDIDFSSRQSGPSEAAYQCLLRWKTRNGDRATFEDLVNKLEDMGYTHLVDELKS